MGRVGDWVALACALSLVALGWWVLVNGFSWPVLTVLAWWFIIGALAAVRPDEWQKRP